MASRVRAFFFAVIVSPLPTQGKNLSSGRHGSLTHPVLEMLKRVRELCGRAGSPHQVPTNLRRLIQQAAIPAEMFARDPDSALPAVKEIRSEERREGKEGRLRGA